MPPSQSSKDENGGKRLMEPDLHVWVEKVPSEEFGRAIGNLIVAITNGLAEADPTMDLRRFYRILVTTDFAGKLRELSTATASGGPIEYTNEEYGVAVAKVLLFPRGSGIEIVLVLDANCLPPVALDDPELLDRDEFRDALHYFHHELCHVHDKNKTIDAFPGVILKAQYYGKDRMIRSLGDACWSEYIANRLSSGTATTRCLSRSVELLRGSLKRTRSLLNAEILAYRTHHDLDRLIDLVSRHGYFLAKSAAYVLGYMDGLKKSSDELSPEAAEELKGSYFEKTWQNMNAALDGLFLRFPREWHDLSVFDELATVMDEYYQRLGFIFSTTELGQLYASYTLHPRDNAATFLGRVLSVDSGG